MGRNRRGPPADPASPVPEPADVIHFGSFEVDMREHRLTRLGHSVAIQEQPFRVLTLLLERRGELVTREEMREAIWPDGTTVDFERGLNTAVNKLRAALRDDAGAPAFIETLPRLGYRFLAPPDVPGPDAEPAPMAAGSGRRRAVVAAAVLGLAVVVLAIAASRWIDGSGGEVAARRSSLAVLPFVDLSGDPQNKFFSAGLTEEMTSRLGRLAPAELGVIARTTMMGYEGTLRPLTEIAEELGVDYILEGSVRRTSDRVRITAQLIQASDQTHLWSEDYDSSVRDILSVQAEVAGRIAKSLAVEVLSETQGSTVVDPVAYAAYLKGLHFRDMLTEDGYRKAIESFEQALSRDPDFAPAYAAMSGCYCLLAGHGLEVAEPSTLMPLTRKFAERALALDSTLSNAQGALGMAYFKHEWDWARAADVLRRATEMNPSDPMARIWYSFYLGSQGRHEEASVQIDEAKRSDPFSRPVNANWGWQRYEARRYEEAAANFSEALELFPGFWIAHWGRGLSRLQLGHAGPALDDLRIAVELSNRNPAALGALGFAHAKLGAHDEARGILNSLLARSREQYVPAVTFVGISMTLMWSANATMALIASAVGAALATAAVVAAFNPALSLANGATIVVSMQIATLLALGFMYDYGDVPFSAFALLAAAPASCWLGEVSLEPLLCIEHLSVLMILERVKFDIPVRVIAIKAEQKLSRDSTRDIGPV